MGFNMEDIHAPTIPSGPVSQSSKNGVGKGGSLQELAVRKENLEAELSALGSVLQSHGVNMNTSLTTFDGYPRNDIDVAQIRTTRSRIIHLKNDHKSLMKELEEAVHAQFASTMPVNSVTGATITTPSIVAAPVTASRVIAAGVPFAKVNSVVEGSPADAAGLKRGDKVTAFGYANWTNHDRLSEVTEIVQQNENRPILVKLLRDTSHLELMLTPRRDWGGRGMLGCHLLPV